jgi:hypothetical protein
MAQRAKTSARRRDRYPVAIDALVYRNDGTRMQARVTDFSDQGCRIESGASFQVGERLQIAIPRMGQIKAQVRWIAAGITGARFLTESDF